ncbi:MAG: choice-of-anchor R domain-containing protein [bacterium]
MAVVTQLLNGTNNTHDYGIQAIPSYLLGAGVRKGFGNECAVTTNQVDTGMVFIEATRTGVSPNETFLVPVRITAPVVVDTSGTGWVIARLDLAKINDGSANASDGTGIAVVEEVASLPGSDPYVILATLSSGVITDARTYSELLGQVAPRELFFQGTDSGSADAYAGTFSDFEGTLRDGMIFVLEIANANTGASTFNPNGVGAKAIRKNYNVALDANDFVQYFFAVMRYDAQNDWFQLQNPVANGPGNDINVKASAADTTKGYLQEKLVDENGDTFDLNSPAGNEKVIIPLSRGGEIPVYMGEAASKGNLITCRKIEIKYYGTETEEDVTSGNIGNASTNIRTAIRITPSKDVDLSSASLLVRLRKVGAPADNLECFIQGDSSGSPDGTSIATATAITGASLTTSFTQQSFGSWGSVTLTKGTPYWIIFSRSSATGDASNYFRLGTVQIHHRTYPFGGASEVNNRYKQYNGSTWSTIGSTYHPYFWNIDFGEVWFKANSANGYACNGPLAMVAAAVSEDDENFANPISMDGWSNLIPGDTYFVAATSGSLSNYSAAASTEYDLGSFRRKAGNAVSIDRFKMDPGKVIITQLNSLGATTTYDYLLHAGIELIEVWAAFVYSGGGDAQWSYGYLDGKGTEQNYFAWHDSSSGLPNPFASTSAFITSGQDGSNRWTGAASFTDVGCSLTFTKFGNPGQLYLVTKIHLA